MTVGEKIKTINNKIEKNKARCNLVGRYGFLTVEDIEPEKKLKKSSYNQKIWIFTRRH